MTANETETHAMWQAKALTEKRFMEVVIAYAQREGWLVYHVYDARRSTPGYPDLHLVHPIAGRSIFAELKKQIGGRISPAQQTWLNALAAAGQTTYVWRPVNWFDGTIPQLLASEETR